MLTLRRADAKDRYMACRKMVVRCPLSVSIHLAARGGLLGDLASGITSSRKPSNTTSDDVSDLP
jgi:hypothetical protein